jgi:putative chitinase
LKGMCATDAGKVACEKYLPFLQKYLPQFGIDTPRRIVDFLAQVGEESGDFTVVRENMNYSADRLAAVWPKRFKGADGKPNVLALSLHRNPEAIANTVYANRLGNGGAASGDGWRNRGVGLLQLTGADNLRRCGVAIGLDLVKHPELLEQPDGAVKAACWYWQTNGINQYSDAGDFDGVCDKVNLGRKTTPVGDAIGYAKRKAYRDRGNLAFGIGG